MSPTSGAGANGAGAGAWPQADPDGRPVRFTSREARPRPDEYMPVLDGAVVRLEPMTDSLNERSRNALLRIGAVQEGIFRNHVITAEGRIRHSVYFSMTSEEWPACKARLERMLG